MVDTMYKYFKYEIALGNAIPMPEPKVDFFPHDQYSVQQFLRTLCKTHIGALGKKERVWAFGAAFAPKMKLSSRPDIQQLFDFAEEMGIIEPVPPGELPPPAEGASAPVEAEAGFVAYRLTKIYWSKFDRFAS
jgi:hypothetical protein